RGQRVCRDRDGRRHQDQTQLGASPHRGDRGCAHGIVVVVATIVVVVAVDVVVVGLDVVSGVVAAVSGSGSVATTVAGGWSLSLPLCTATAINVTTIVTN